MEIGNYTPKFISFPLRLSFSFVLKTAIFFKVVLIRCAVNKYDPIVLNKFSSSVNLDPTIEFINGTDLI